MNQLSLIGTGFFPMFGWLLFAHILLDFALQGDFMAKAKNHTQRTPGVPPFFILTLHSYTHAFAVYLITGSLTCFVIELLSHALIDYLKSTRTISFKTDQVLHIGLKAVYAACLTLQ